MEAGPGGAGAPGSLPPSALGTAELGGSFVPAPQGSTGAGSATLLPLKLPFLLCVVAAISRKKHGASSRAFPQLGPTGASGLPLHSSQRMVHKTGLALEGQHLRDEGCLMCRVSPAGQGSASREGVTAT